MKPLIKRFINHADREGIVGTRGQINKINWLTVWEMLSASFDPAYLDVARRIVRGNERIPAEEY